jgi:ribosomal protein S11
VLFSTSSGSNGFKNSKKSTTTGAQAAALTMSEVKFINL